MEPWMRLSLEAGTSLSTHPAPTFSSSQRCSPLSQVRGTDGASGVGLLQTRLLQSKEHVCSSAEGTSRGTCQQIWTHEEQMETDG